VRGDGVRRLSESALVVLGVVCLGYYGYHTLEARHVQREQTAAFEALLAEAGRQQLPGETAPSVQEPVIPERAESVAAAESTAAAPPASADRAPVSPAVPASARRVTGRPEGSRLPGTAAGVMALLEIPRLKMSSPVMSGDDDATLRVAVGHLPDTPSFWEPGNSAVAAHRDGLFRPLRHIRIGDQVRVRTVHGEFDYVVRETKIVDPEDLSVLAPGEHDRLTLITCYPFNFVGNAPKRFIVHAERSPGR
jgi:sortase A